jgi:hypothetical protein
MPRFELPANLSPEEERAVLAALERVLGSSRGRPSPWAVAGRVEALRLGALQARREAGGWPSRGQVPFVRRGTPPLIGRGDAK